MDEEELQQDIRTLEFYRAQLESYDQQYELMVMTLREFSRAKETMEGYKDLEEGAETLIPVGGSSFLHAKVAQPGKSMVGIGSDYAMETDMDDAVNKLDQRIKDIEEAMNNLGESYREITHKAAELTNKIQSAYATG